MPYPEGLKRFKTMEEKTPAVEKKVEVAAPQQEVDLQKELETTRAALTKKTEESDNYKRGMLKAKGKLPEDSQKDDENSETMDEKIARIAREELAKTEISQLQAKEKQTVDAIIKRNKELELALKNRGQISEGSGDGSNQEKPEVKQDDYLSKEQVQALKAKGWDDKKIELFKKNAKAGTNPK